VNGKRAGSEIKREVSLEVDSSLDEWKWERGKMRPPT